MRKRYLAYVLAALPLGSVALAQTSQAVSSTYSVQVPVTTVPFTPSKTTYDFGNVLVGQAPQHLFTFVNRGSAVLTVSGVTTFLNANVVEDNCSGKKLQGGEACTVLGALRVTQAATATGELRVTHSASTMPDVFALRAVGVSAAGVITATEPSINFGDASPNQTIGPKSISFKNTGSTPVEILDLSLAEGGASYTLDISGCVTKIAPGASCSMSATFKPQALGQQQGRIVGMLDDGSEVSLVNLMGAGVQGTPTWSATQVNFMDGQPNVKSVNQVVTLTNTGKGVLAISSAAITGDATFKLESHNCGTTLAPGASCSLQVSNTPIDTAIRTGYLELQTSNSSLKTARIQVYSRPLLQKAVLAVDPLSVDFGDVGVGTTKVTTVTLKSVGNIPVNVSKYALGGTNAAAFSVLNASQCTGALAPNNQCALQIQTKPAVTGAQQATLTIAADTADPVPVLQLNSNGLGAAVSTDKVNLSFGSVSQGDTATLSATFSNTGGAPAKLNSIQAPQGLGVFTNTRDTSGACQVGGTLAAGASCKLNVTFLTAGLTGAQTGSFVMGFSSGAITVTTTGVSVPPPLPTATLSTFTCPATVTAGTTFSCTGVFSNTGVGNLVLAPANGISLSNNSFGAGQAAPSSNCPTEAQGGLAPGKSCLITINGKAGATTTWQTGVSASFKRVGTFTAATLPQNSGSTSSTATAGVFVPQPLAALTDLSCDTTNGQIGTAYLCTSTLSSTGNVPLTFNAKSFTYSDTSGTLTTDCPTTLPAGTGACKLTIKGKITATGLATRTLTVTSNAPTVRKSLGLIGVAASLKLTTASHPVVQVGDSSTAVHTVTNQGSWTVNMTKAATASGIGLSVTGTTCGSSLSAGASCTITTRCAPSAATSQPSLTIYPEVANSFPTTVAVGCEGRAPSLRMTSAYPTETITSGAYSQSGNWYRVTNTGIGAATLSSIGLGGKGTAQTFLGYLVYYDGAKPDHCAPGKVLPVNGSCVFLVTGNHPAGMGGALVVQVLSNAAPIVDTKTMSTVYGLDLVPTQTPAATTLTGLTEAVDIRVTNQADWPIYNLKASLDAKGTTEANKGYSIVGNNCPATLGSRTSCIVSVVANAPTTPASLAGTVSVSGSYPQVLNGVAYPPVGTAVQGTVRLALRVASPRLAVLAGTFAPVGIGEEAQATFVVQNLNDNDIQITGAPRLDLPYYSVVSSTCSGRLASKQDCRVVVRYKPMDTSQSKPGTLTVPSNVGAYSATASGKLKPIAAQATQLSTRAYPPTVSLDDISRAFAGTALTVQVVMPQVNSTTPITSIVRFSDGGAFGVRGRPTCDKTTSACKVLSDTEVQVVTSQQQYASFTISGTASSTPGDYTFAATVTPVDYISTSQSNGATRTIRVDGRPGVADVTPSHTGFMMVQGNGEKWYVGTNPLNQLGVGYDGAVQKNITWSKYADIPYYQVSLPGVTHFESAPLLDHMFALTANGDLYVIGKDSSECGNLGNGNTKGDLLTRYVKVLSNVSRVSAGLRHTLAITKDGTLWMAGCNNAGPAGSAMPSNPLFSPVMAGVKAAAAGLDYSYVVKNDGSVWVAGGGTSLVLGQDISVKRNPYTWTKVFASGARDVAATREANFVLTNNDDLYVVSTSNGNSSSGTGAVPTNIVNWTKVLGGVATISTSRAPNPVPATAALMRDGSVFKTGAVFSATGAQSTAYTFTKVFQGNAAQAVVDPINGSVLVRGMDGSVWSDSMGLAPSGTGNNFRSELAHETPASGFYRLF